MTDQALRHKNREPTRVQRSVVVPAVTSFPSCAKAHPPLSAGGDEVVATPVEVGALLVRLEVTADVADDGVGVGVDGADVVVVGLSLPASTTTVRMR